MPFAAERQQRVWLLPGLAQVMHDRPELAGKVAAIAERTGAQSADRLQQAGLPPPAHGDLLARILAVCSLPA